VSENEKLGHTVAQRPFFERSSCVRCAVVGHHESRRLGDVDEWKAKRAQWPVFQKASEIAPLWERLVRRWVEAQKCRPKNASISDQGSQILTPTVLWGINPALRNLSRDFIGLVSERPGSTNVTRITSVILASISSVKIWGFSQKYCLNDSQLRSWVQHLYWYVASGMAFTHQVELSSCVSQRWKRGSRRFGEMK
jgi:hypothetical protein